MYTHIWTLCLPSCNSHDHESDTVVKARIQPELILHKKHQYNKSTVCRKSDDEGKGDQFIPISRRNMLSRMHSEDNTINQLVRKFIKKELSKSICNFYFSSLKRRRRNMNTWKRVRWMRWRINRGQLNQKCLSETCTRGMPWTTACLSWISTAIWVIIACSFVPTARTTFNRFNG